jgi:hypothetical protein
VIRGHKGIGLHLSGGIDGENPVAAHHGGLNIQIGDIIEAIVAIGTGQIGPLPVELSGEGVIEFLAGAPEEANAKLPGWFYPLEKYLLGKAKNRVEHPGKGDRCSFTDAYDSNFLAANDLYLAVWKASLERNGREKAGRAASDYEHFGDRFIRHFFLCRCGRICGCSDRAQACNLAAKAGGFN